MFQRHNAYGFLSKKKTGFIYQHAITDYMMKLEIKK